MGSDPQSGQGNPGQGSLVKAVLVKAIPVREILVREIQDNRSRAKVIPVREIQARAIRAATELSSLLGLGLQELPTSGARPESRASFRTEDCLRRDGAPLIC